MPRGRPRKTQGDILLKSAEMIGWAIGGIEREIIATRDRLAALTAQANALRAKLPRGASRPAGESAPGVSGEAPAAAARPARRRRQMSPEARQRMSEMMKKRWAERRAAGDQPVRARKRRKVKG